MHDDRQDLWDRYRRIRARSEQLCTPLSAEDCVVQAIEDVSPPKWHLAHTTWFFETFLLTDLVSDYRPHHPGYDFLFNSYYVGIGPRHVRAQRGLLTRPSLEEVRSYRRVVDGRMAELFDALDEPGWARAMPLVALGLNHEQQHQELLLTDVKYNLSLNPLLPAYDPDLPAAPAGEGAATWLALDPGLIEVGHAGPGFAYDNEGPRHRVFVAPFALRSAPVTSGEFLEFVEDGGYREPRWWLSDGWAAVEREGWEAPLYWQREGSGWREFTLGGVRALQPGTPVAHVSHYEADAFARWAGARLPTEFEWEAAVAASGAAPEQGHFADDGVLHPAAAAGAGEGPRQLFGDVWEWTASAYLPYPGFRPAVGAVGEYNGKFMSGQMVLRGGSVASPRGHLRASYRNFFAPDRRWQFSGLRLAADREPGGDRA